MTPQEQAQAWNFIESCISKIVDPVLQNTVRGQLQQRAREEWGFCPDTHPQVEVDGRPTFLSPEDEDMLERIQMAQKYNVYIPPEDNCPPLEKMIKEDIDAGGCYALLPKNLQTPIIKEIYDKVEAQLKREIEAQIENVISASLENAIKLPTGSELHVECTRAPEDSESEFLAHLFNK